MYKISLVLLVITVVCTALPALDQHVLAEEHNELAERVDRLPRATCDLLSFSAGGISVNHAACAAHCLTNGRGNRGGRCSDGVCICRK